MRLGLVAVGRLSPRDARPPQGGRADLFADQRQPLGQIGDLLRLRPRHLRPERAPDHGLEGIDGPGLGLGILGSGDLARARDERLERPAGLDPAQVGVVRQGSHDGVADPRSVAGQVSRQDPRRVVERRLLEQRQQPALGQILGGDKERVDGSVGHGPRPAPPWRSVLHSAVFYHDRQSLKRPQGDNTYMSEDLISIRAAQESALRSVRRLGFERIPIEDALDRVLAEDVSARGDVPPFACSAMDGYAVAPGPARRALQIVGESRAGAPSDQRLADGEAIRISTGAAVPSGAAAVIPQENVSRKDSWIETQADLAEGENVRRPGEDMTAGTLVLGAGVRLGGAELGAAVAAGAGSVVVAARPRVSVLCTGDELRAPGEPLGPGEIHNSNAPMLVALATRCGGSVAPAVRLPDDREATEDGLRSALERIRRAGDLRWRIGRPPRPRQAGAREPRRG